MGKGKFLDRETFDTLLANAVMPTIDLVVEHENNGVIIVRRKIAPYKNVWALPGLRMMKGENIEDVMRRIAKNELGLTDLYAVKANNRQIIDQYDGKFTTENARQDLSTGYAIRAKGPITLNKNHFSGMRYVRKQADLPKQMGAMYRHYLKKYLPK